MNVLQLGPFPPPHGGLQTNLAAIRTALLKRGLPGIVINLNRTRRPDAEGVYYPRNAMEVLRLLWRLPADIVHLHVGGNLTPRLLGLAVVCTLLPGRKAVLSFHSGGYPTSPAGRSARPGSLRGWVFRRFDRIIAVNQEISAMFRRFGVRESRLGVIEPSPIPEVPSDAMMPEPIREFIRSHDPLLVSVGLLEPEYDLPLQIDVMGRVRAQWPGAGLVIAGSGSLEDELRERIQAKPYAAHVLLAGDVPHAAALELMRQARAMLRTTWYDGDSVAVREALHFGTPVIATENAMRPSGVWLIPVGDAAALVECIRGVLATGPAIGRQMRPGGEDPIAEVIRLYEELVPEGTDPNRAIDPVKPQ